MTTEKTGTNPKREVETPFRPGKMHPTPTPTPKPDRAYPTALKSAAGVVRGLLIVSLLLGAGATQAQNDKRTDRNTGTTTQSPQGGTRTQGNQQGWMMWDQRMGKDIGLSDDQLQQYRDVDASYRARYNALGTKPWMNSGYDALTREREDRFRSMMTPEQFDRWQRTYGSGRTTGNGQKSNDRNINRTDSLRNNGGMNDRNTNDKRTDPVPPKP